MREPFPPGVSGKPDGPFFDAIGNQLAEVGYAIYPCFLEPGLTRQLLEEFSESGDDGTFRRAAVGRGGHRQLRGEVRTDEVCWLEPGLLTVVEQAYWQRTEALRESLNRTLFLGLFELEAHLARFSQGGFYKAHLDRHQGTQSRVLSVVVYLDEDWLESDGGQLRIYTDRRTGAGGPFLDVFPEPGKLALFLSGEIWHEVLPTRRVRHSVTGWFRGRELAPT